MRIYWNRESAFNVALKFTNKRDFKSRYIGAYEFLRKNKFLDEATKHMKRPYNINKIWNYEKCKVAALSCETLKEFRLKYENAYKHSKINGWADEFNVHMKKYQRPVIWNKNMCQIEAKKYSYRIDFYRNSSKAYAACIRNGWLDDVCKHMGKKNFKWTKEICQQEALKYKFRKEFQNGSNRIYHAAKYNGWLDEICKHMKYKKLPNRYWHDIENCRREALKYKTKTEFVKKSQHVYCISLKYGWLDEICKHMTPIGDRYHKCIYSYEFPDNHVYVGLTRNIEIRETSRRNDVNDAVTKHISETKLAPIRKQLTEYVPVEKAIILEGEYLNKYIFDGWIPLNRAKTGGIGSRSNRKFKMTEN